MTEHEQLIYIVARLGCETDLSPYSPQIFCQAVTLRTLLLFVRCSLLAVTLEVGFDLSLSHIFIVVFDMLCYVQDLALNCFGQCAAKNKIVQN